MKFFDYAFEIVGWICIALSPALVGCLIGGLFYLAFPNNVGYVLMVFVGASGMVIGGVWATQVWRKVGTVTFLSKI
ncbi:MAG TPA: hypothetical protein VK202_02985, partial [Bacteroidia bacterium]|nr:hypothetical protein [Bacteroidia bacterium]